MNFNEGNAGARMAIFDSKRDTDEALSRAIEADPPLLSREESIELMITAIEAVTTWRAVYVIVRRLSSTLLKGWNQSKQNR